MTEVVVNLKAKVGDRCIAQNYRSKYKPWENGIVSFIRVCIDKDLKCWISYEVKLLRCSRRKFGSGYEDFPIFLTVNDTAIELSR